MDKNKKNIKDLIKERRIKSYSELTELIKKRYSDMITNMFKVLITSQEDTDLNFVFKESSEHREEVKLISKDDFYNIRDYLNGTREVYFDRNEYWNGYNPQRISAIIMEYKYDLKISSYSTIVEKLSDYYNSTDKIPFEYFCIINRDTIQFIFPVDIRCSNKNIVQKLDTIEEIRTGLDKLLSTMVRGTLSNNDCHMLIPGAIYNGYQAVSIIETHTEIRNNLSDMYERLCNKPINITEEKEEPKEILSPNTQSIPKRTSMGSFGQWIYYRNRSLNIIKDINFLVQYKNMSMEQQEKLIDITTKMLLQVKNNANIYKKCPEDILTEEDIKNLIIGIYNNIGIKLNNIEKINKDKFKKIYNNNCNLIYFKNTKTGKKEPMYKYSSKKFLDILQPTETESTYLIELLTDEELERRRQIRIKNNNQKICERSKQKTKENRDKKNEEFKTKYLKLKEQGLSKTQIAKELKIGRQTLYSRLKKLGIE